MTSGNLVERISALIILIIFFPLFVVLAAVIAVQLRQCPFFVQKRGLTLENKNFNIIKFRTIKTKPCNETEKKEYRDIFYKEELSGSLSSFSGWLRRTGLDELPQLINIVRGEMSFTGPRPMMPADLRIMKEQFELYYFLRGTIKCKPGITGLWQLLGKRENGMSDLIELDMLYETMKTPLFNLKIIAATIPYVLLAYNSDSIIKGRRTVFGKMVTEEKRSKIRKRIVRFLGIEKTDEVLRRKIKELKPGFQFSGENIVNE